MCRCIRVGGAGTLVSQDEIHRMVQSTEVLERRHAINEICDIFSFPPDKQQAWDDLHRLTEDTDSYVRRHAVEAVGIAFLIIPDKQQAWDDLHRLTKDTVPYVRGCSAEVLSTTYLFLPDRKQVWDDIHRLTKDYQRFVRERAVDAVCLVFSNIPYKSQALAEDDLISLTRDKDNRVRRGAAKALGFVFSNLPNKEQASENLIRLTQDEDKDVRASANYSLGRASIFKANEAQNGEILKKQLEIAIDYFENSIVEAVSSANPARFCTPFYRSFFIMAFRKQVTEAEIRKYLAEAKSVCKGSSSKEKLLEAVENLSSALKEVQRARDFNEIKSDLNAYRRYCSRAADLLAATEEKAPGATKLIRMGLPIIDQTIKEIISEIQENAKALCKQTKDTPLEDLGKEVIRVSQAFPQVRDPIGLEKGFINLWTALSSICAKMPEEERGEACELLKKADNEPYIEDKLPLINMVLSKISSQISAAKNIETVEKKLDEIMVSLKPGIREELIITVGAEFGGTGAQHVITIPLQDISYPGLKKDLEKINGKGILKLSSLPAKLAEKVKSYLVRNEKDKF